MDNYRTNLGSRCGGLARALSYNVEGEDVIKHTLYESAHFIDSQSVRVHKNGAKILIINARGKSRRMTMRERLAYWILGGNTEIRP